MTDLAFTIATLVTDRDEYQVMRESFVAKGFGDDCEFLPLDNSESNNFDGYTGFNEVLQKARGRFVIFSHQDVRLDFDDRSVLEARLSALEDIDPKWAVVGNAGGCETGELVIRITDPWGDDRRVGEFPSRVCSLDSNFILVKNETRVAFSTDLHGYHYYGSDICMQAEMRGYRAYVIDFHLRHLSEGRLGKAYQDARARFIAKWEHALRPRFLRSTVDFFILDGDATAAVDLTSPREVVKLARLSMQGSGGPAGLYHIARAAIGSAGAKLRGR